MRLRTHPGLKVTLRVNRQNLQEYNDDADDDGAEHEAYVEATPGANFTVELRADERFTYMHNELSCNVFLDGNIMTGRILTPCPARGHGKISITGAYEYRDGLSYGRKFTFADLTTTNGQPKPELKKKLANLGEVTVKIYRVRRTGWYAPGEIPTRVEETVGKAGVPEKALKGRAISSRATLGDEAPVPQLRTAKVDYPWGRDPFATFTFKYRSRKDLQIEGIIPRSPSPVPLEDRNPDTLTAEEARELVKIQRQRLLDQVRVKKEEREREDDEEGEDADEDGEVTMTGVRSKRPKLSNDPGIEVIDLSNEDSDGDV